MVCRWPGLSLTANQTVFWPMVSENLPKLASVTSTKVLLEWDTLLRLPFLSMPRSRRVKLVTGWPAFSPLLIRT